MPSDFIEGRAQPKTLPDLIKMLDEGPRKHRPAMTTSPLSGPRSYQGGNHNKTKPTKKTESKRRSKIVSEALKGLEI